LGKPISRGQTGRGALYLSVVSSESYTVSGHHQHLLAWMNRFHASEESYSLVSNLSETDVELILQKAQSFGVEGTVVHQVGSQLALIVTSVVYPLTLMMEDGLLFEIYGDESSTHCYSYLIAYIKLLVFQNSQMSGLEV
jgi:hypothetical protein